MLEDGEKAREGEEGSLEYPVSLLSRHCGHCCRLKVHFLIVLDTIAGGTLNAISAQAPEFRARYCLAGRSPWESAPPLGVNRRVSVLTSLSQPALPL